MAKLTCLFLFLVMALISGCVNQQKGTCFELTDGSGRKGIQIKYKNGHLLRMTDTENVELKESWEVVLVDNAQCQKL